MPRSVLIQLALLLCISLGACQAKVSPELEPALEEASAYLQQVRLPPGEDKEAAEMLAFSLQYLSKAESLARNWRPKQEVLHYVELSKRYATIAEELEALRALKRQLALQEDTQALIARLGLESTPRGLHLMLDELTYEPGAALPRDDQISMLKQVASFLTLYSRSKLLVEGYTDSMEATEREQQLSLERAEAVAAGLELLGISKDRIQSIGYGAAYPRRSNQNPLGRASNRRVELMIGGPEQAFPAIRRP